MLKVDIYWDLRATVPARHTGVGKHVIEVVGGLNSSAEVDIRILLASDQLALWSEQSAAFGWSAIRTKRLPFTNKSGRLFAGCGRSPGLDALVAGRDLVYSPMELLLVPKQLPFINTIHGIPCFEESLPARSYKSRQYRLERVKQRYFFSRCRRHCRRSFVVSDYLRQQLLERFGWSDKQLHAVYNGADDLFFAADHAADSASARHERIRLLQVGGANAFDGAPDLLKVARYLNVHQPKAKIWIAGDRHEPPWEESLRAMHNVVWLGFLDSRRLLSEMRGSTALLYLPTVESFGIIGVEAMASGLPILASRSSSLPEVLGDAACWFDPGDPQSIQNAIEMTCHGDDERDALIRRGRERAARYTWPQTVERVLAGLRASVPLPVS